MAYGTMKRRKLFIIFVFLNSFFFFFILGLLIQAHWMMLKTVQHPGTDFLSRWFQLSFFGLLPNITHPRHGDIPA